MRRDLVAVGVHALDNGRQFRSGVDLTLVDVGTRDEEGSFSIVGLENIQDMGSVLLKRTVIEGKSNSTRRFAAINASSSIGYGAKLRASNG